VRGNLAAPREPGTPRGRTLTLHSQVPTPAAYAPYPMLETLNSKPCILHPTSQARNPNPRTINTSTLHPEAYTLTPTL